MAFPLKILITGNMGYVGQRVVEQLRFSYPDAMVTGLDAGYFAGCVTNALRSPESMVDVQYYSDVRNFPKDVLSEVDAIVHLAAISNDPMGKTLEKATFDINRRFPTGCGMSERLRLDLVLNDFVAGAVVSKKFTVLSDGTPWRPLINVKDMARAIGWAVKRRGEEGGDFLALNVGGEGWNYQIKDLAFVVAELVPGVSVEINRNAQPDKRTYKVNFRLFRELAPNYQPEVSLRETINELSAGLKAVNFSDGDYRNSMFMRLNMLNALHQKGFITETLEWRKRKSQKTIR